MSGAAWDELVAAQASDDPAQMAAAMKQLRASDPAVLKQAVDEAMAVGNAEFRKGRHREALDCYNQAIAGDEQRYKAFSNRSACLLALGDPEQAATDARAVVGMQPTWAKGHYRLGRALLAMGDLYAETACAAFSRGTELEPSNAEMVKWNAKSMEVVVANRQKQTAKAAAEMAAEEAANAPAGGAEAGAEDELKIETVEGGPDQATLNKLLSGEAMTAEEAAQMEGLEGMPEPQEKYHASFDPNSGFSETAEDSAAANALRMFLQDQSEISAPTRQISTLADSVLMEQYLAAIAAVHSGSWSAGENADWLLLGTGTCVPTMQAIQLSAANGASVTAVTDHIGSLMLSAAHRILIMNEMRDAVKIIHSRVESVELGEEEPVPEGARQSHTQKAMGKMARRAKRCVIDPDLMDAALLASRLLPAVDYARRELLEPEPVFVPSAACVYAQPIHFAASSDVAGGLNFSAIENLRWMPGYEPVDMRSQQHCTALSAPVKVYDVDFATFGPEKLASAMASFEVAATQSAVANAVVFWFEAAIDSSEGAAAYSTAERSEGGAAAWKQAVQWIAPVAVAAGDTIKLSCHSSATRLRFRIDEPAPPPAAFKGIVARWHFDMLADGARSAAYSAALSKALEKKLGGATEAVGGGTLVEVLDIGCGSGMTPLLVDRAAKAQGAEDGAVRITGSDTSKSMLECAANVVKVNGAASSSINLLHRDSRMLRVGLTGSEELLKEVDMQRRADICVLESFDYGLLGEGCLPLIHHAHTHLLADDALIVPANATVHCVLAEMRTEEVGGFNTSLWNTYRFSTSYTGVDLERQNGTRLSKQHEVFRFDFSRAAMGPATTLGREEKVFKAKVSKSGTMNCVVFWFELGMGSGVDSVSSEPGSRAKGGHWLQAVQMVEEIKVEEGDTIPIKCMHDATQIMFGIDREKVENPPYADRRTSVPMYDPLWLQGTKAVEEKSGQIAQMIGSSEEGRKEATEAAVQIALDPNARAGARLDPEGAGFFATSFFA